jgi:hypothetical protein
VSNLRFPGSIPSFERDAQHDAHAPDAEALSVVGLIRAGTLDVELAALLWVLVEGRVPILVGSGPRLAGKTTVLDALLGFLPPAAAVRELTGFDENFDWLPEAARLGWRSDRGPGHDHRHAPNHSAMPVPPAAITPKNGVLVAAELSPHLPWYTWGEQARIAVRATSLGYGLGSTVHADSLEELLDSLRGPDVRLTDDELSHLGVVLILRAFRGGGGGGGGVTRRIVAAHYLRPVSRDAGGHVQRLPPAVLATWNAGTDRFEHFAWGSAAELADRVHRTRADFDTELERRGELLAGLATAGATSASEVRSAIDGYRLTGTAHRN